jgi:DNA-binding protein Fis
MRTETTGLLSDEVEKTVIYSDMTFDEVEAAYVRLMLDAHKGNKRRAAMAMDIARSTLLAMIRRHNIVFDRANE